MQDSRQDGGLGPCCSYNMHHQYKRVPLRMRQIKGETVVRPYTPVTLDDELGHFDLVGPRAMALDRLGLHSIMILRCAVLCQCCLGHAWAQVIKVYTAGEDPKHPEVRHTHVHPCGNSAGSAIAALPCMPGARHPSGQCVVLQWQPASLDGAPCSGSRWMEHPALAVAGPGLACMGSSAA